MQTWREAAGSAAGPAARRCGSARAKAAVLDAAFLADVSALPAPSDVEMVFHTVAPLANSGCLVGLSGAAGPGGGLGMLRAPALAGDADPSVADVLEAATCLVTPVVLEESAAEILLERQGQLEAELEADLRLRYASELASERLQLAAAGSSQQQGRERWVRGPLASFPSLPVGLGAGAGCQNSLCSSNARPESPPPP